MRSTWDPQPVAVEVRELDFVSACMFGAEPVLANAFYVNDIDYRWERGRLLTTERGRNRGASSAARECPRGHS